MITSVHCNNHMIHYYYIQNPESHEFKVLANRYEEKMFAFFLQRLAVAIREGSQHRRLGSVLIAVKLKKDGGIWDGQLRDVLSPKQSEQCTFDASDMKLLPEWANIDMRPTA